MTAREKPWRVRDKTVKLVTKAYESSTQAHTGNHLDDLERNANLFDFFIRQMNFRLDDWRCVSLNRSFSLRSSSSVSFTPFPAPLIFLPYRFVIVTAYWQKLEKKNKMFHNLIPVFIFHNKNSSGRRCENEIHTNRPDIED